MQCTMLYDPLDGFGMVLCECQHSLVGASSSFELEAVDFSLAANLLCKLII